MGFLMLGVSALPVSASILWTWEYSTSRAVASGTFITASSPEASGGYPILAITGLRNGQTIDHLQAPGTSIPGNEPYTVDDLVFLGPGPQLTSNGFGFALADGTFANPFFANFLPTPSYLEFFSIPDEGHTELDTIFSATPVTTPEPATFALVLGGVAVISCLQKRSNTEASNASS